MAGGGASTPRLCPGFRATGSSGTRAGLRSAPDARRAGRGRAAGPRMVPGPVTASPLWRFRNCPRPGRRSSSPSRRPLGRPARHAEQRARRQPLQAVVGERAAPDGRRLPRRGGQVPHRHQPPADSLSSPERPTRPPYWTRRSAFAARSASPALRNSTAMLRRSSGFRGSRRAASTSWYATARSASRSTAVRS